MLFLFNSTNKHYLKLDNLVSIQVCEADKGLKKVHAVVVCMETHAPTPVAFFSKEEEANRAMNEIVNFVMGEDSTFYPVENGILKIEDNIEETLIVAPDTLKGKNGLNRVK